MEVSDDYNVFADKGVSAGAYAYFYENPVLPIKTYEEIDHDPMNTILNVFSKLKKGGEGAAIQLIVCPAGEKFTKEFHMILDDVKSGKFGQALPRIIFTNCTRRFGKPQKNVIFGAI